VLLENISKLEIPTNKIYYDKKSNVLAIEILNFTFIGIYKKSTRLSKILDDIYNFLGEIHINREDISFVDFISNTVISETTKLKNLGLLEKKEFEKKEEQKVDKDVRTKADVVEKEKVERIKTIAPPREAPKKKKAKESRKREMYGEEKAESYKMKEEAVESADMLLYDEDEEFEMAEEEALPPPAPAAGAPPAPT